MTTITLLTMNTRASKYDKEDKPYTWSKRKKAIKELYARNDGHNNWLTDIICFQEYDAGNHRFFRRELTIKRQYDCYLGCNNSINDTDYNAIYWKMDVFDLAESGNFWLHPTGKKEPAWDADEARSCVWVRLYHRKTNCYILVLNMHLDHTSDLARQKAACQIGTMIKQIRHNGDIVFIMGDANANTLEMDESIVPLTNKSYEILKEYGYRDTFMEAGYPNSRKNFTFHGFYKDEQLTKLRTDWILCQGDIEIAKAYILKDSPADIFPTDHFPGYTKANI